MSVPPRAVRVLPDMAAVPKEFDYLVPDAWHHDGRAERLRVGTMVRVPLHGRRVAGWVVALDPDTPPGLTLAPLAKLSGEGPDAEIIDLARWAARRWVGPVSAFLGTASPDTMVGRPAPRRRSARPEVANEQVRAAFSGAGHVLRLGPATDPFPLVLGAASCGNALVVVPSLEQAAALTGRLRDAGVAVARHPQDWAVGAAGATVIGTRSAAWAPVADLAAVLVLDEHEEVHQQEQSPTWHARDVALERARRAGVPCVLASPMPSLEALEALPLLTVPRGVERSGWPLVEVVDLRVEDPGKMASPDALVRLLRQPGRVAVVLNRTGRSRLLACHNCGELATCQVCAAAMTQPGERELVCATGEHRRPIVCPHCGGTTMRNLRAGTTRLREELEALIREPVVEVTATTDHPDARRARVVVGTEAALYRAGPRSAVAFTDFDQELTAPRYRAGEQALGLLARAARLVGGRDDDGRLLVMTRQPDHPVLEAARLADPSIVAEADRARRRLLRFPPFAAIAQVSGTGAAEFVERLGRPLGVEVLGPRDGAWLIRAADHEVLTDVLRAVPRPKARLRLAVDPLRI